ncbi:hypothetical protein [Fusobacterium necrophorum]|uniref:hypothetical protein n=1 Tax=Fusobacterium necrophorum TaxID=859 RepID=UPI00370DE497
MKGEKVFTFANFNCVFETGDKKKSYPMLEFFDVIHEASFLDRRYRGLFLHEVKLIKTENAGICLYGKIVKNTTLEIESRFDESKQKLIEIDEQYKASPYSEFILILQNHRLIFTPNQKGSPSLSNLSSVYKRNILQVLKKRSVEEKILQNLEFKLNISEIPKKAEVLKELKEFEKISLFKLDFFELNNDDLSDFFDKANEIKDRIGSKEMKQEYKNPTNKAMIAKMIQETEGKADITLVANKKDEKDVCYKNADFKEKKIIYLPEESTKDENINRVIAESITDQRLREISPANKTAYEKALEKFAFLRSLL